MPKLADSMMSVYEWGDVVWPTVWVNKNHRLMIMPQVIFHDDYIVKVNIFSASMRGASASSIHNDATRRESAQNDVFVCMKC